MKIRARHWLIATTLLGFFTAATLLFEDFFPIVLGLMILSLLILFSIFFRDSRKKREKALKVLSRLMEKAREIQKFKKT